MPTRHIRVACVALSVIFAASVSACSSSGTQGASDSTSGPAASGKVITTGKADPSASPVNIMFYGSNTGAAAQYASVVRPPEQLALDRINNEEGGINGHPLKVTIVDAQMDPSQAVQLYHASASKAVGIVGIFSPEVAAVGPLAKAAKIPFVSEASASDQVAKGRPYVWSVSPDTFRVSTLATDKWLKAVPDLKSVVVAEDKFDSFFDSQAGAVETELKAKGVSVTGLGYSADTTNFSSLVSRIKGLHADGVVIGGTAAQGAAILAELRSQGVKASVLVTQSVYTGSFTTTAGNNANDIYAYLPLYLGGSGSADFNARFKKLVGSDPTWAAGECYEMFEVIAQALRQGHVEGIQSLSGQRAALQSELPKVKVTGVDGSEISFGKDGLATRVGALIYQDSTGAVKLVD